MVCKLVSLRTFNMKKYQRVLLVTLLSIELISCKKALDYNPINNIIIDRTTIVGDDNHDGIINRGETAYLDVNLKNTGTSASLAVNATFSTNSIDITGLTPQTAISYGDIPNGTSGSAGTYGYLPGGYTNYTIKFKVSYTSPLNTPIPINIIITDASGNTRTTSFTIIVKGIGANITYDSSTIVYDDNHDGIINRGETAYLDVSLKNTGNSKSLGVNATFSTNSSDITGLKPQTAISYGDISAGQSIIGNSNISFKVSSAAPLNTPIPINILITDASGNTWTSSFTIIVKGSAANIVFDTKTIVYDDNHDGIINRGETAYLDVSLKNTGNSKSLGVNATFSTNSSDITGLKPQTAISYGDISAGQSNTGNSSGLTPNYLNYNISFKVSSTAPLNTPIPINILITDASGNTWTSSFTIIVKGTAANIVFDTKTIVYDDNHDGIINRGETAYLNVSLKNTGTSTSLGVNATFTSSGYITGLKPQTAISYGDISAGQSNTGNSSGWTPNYLNYNISFKVSSAAPLNTPIPINILITDAYGNSWTSYFNVNVQ